MTTNPQTDRYRKRPVEVDAIQWTGENVVAVLKFFDAGRSTTVVNINAPADRSQGWIEIPTLEGKMRASVGDWIIRGVQGEFYPCKPDIFAATYEPAVSVPASAPTDETALAVRLAEAVQHGPTWTLPRSLAEEISVAVLAVLPAPAGQTALLRTAALIEERADDLWAPGTKANDEMRADAAGLRRIAAAVSGSGRVADETQAPVHVGGGANAEDCPACHGTNPDYPFICPGTNAGTPS